MIDRRCNSSYEILIKIDAHEHKIASREESPTREKMNDKRWTSANLSSPVLSPRKGRELREDVVWVLYEIRNRMPVKDEEERLMVSIEESTLLCVKEMSERRLPRTLE